VKNSLVERETINNQSICNASFVGARLVSFSGVGDDVIPVFDAHIQNLVSNTFT
jgi:hypothetical protein